MKIIVVGRYKILLLSVGIWFVGVAGSHAARLSHCPVNHRLRELCGQNRVFSNARRCFRERKHILRANADKHLMRVRRERSKTDKRIRSFSDRVHSWRMSGF